MQSSCPRGPHRSHATRQPGPAGRRALLAAAPAGRVEHAIPGVAERLELGGAEEVEEHRAHAGEVGGARGAQLLAAGRRELGELAAGVVAAGDALEQALARQAVDEPGQAAAAEQDRGGEVAHPHALVLGVREVHEHLVGAELQAVGGLELCVERLGHRRVRAQHAAPGAQLGGREQPQVRAFRR